MGSFPETYNDQHFPVFRSRSTEKNEEIISEILGTIPSSWFFAFLYPPSGCSLHV